MNELLGKIENEEIRGEIKSALEKLQDIEAKNIEASIYNKIATGISQKFNIEVPENVNVIDFIDIATQKHYEPQLKAIDEYKARIKELETKGLTEEEIKKQQLLSEQYDKLEIESITAINDLKKQLKLKEQEYNQTISALSRENIYNKIIPSVHESYLEDDIFKAGFESYLSKLKQEFEQEYDLLNSNEAQHKLRTTKVINPADWFNEKLSKYTQPRKIQGGNAGVSMKTSNGEAVTLNVTKGSPRSERYPILRDYVASLFPDGKMNKKYSQTLEKLLKETD